MLSLLINCLRISFVYFFKEGLFAQWQLEQWRKKWVEVSISWLQLQTVFMQSWKLCLNLWLAKLLNLSPILVTNFIPSLLSTLNAWLGSGLVNFSITLSKTLEVSNFNTNLVPLHYNCRKKIIFEKFAVVLKKHSNFFEHFL